MTEFSYYYCDVYHDILDDFDCLGTRFRFETEEVAKQFIQNVSDKFVCTGVFFEKSTAHNKHRPIYSSLTDALDDAEEFYQYGDSEKYRFTKNVFRVCLDIMCQYEQENRIQILQQKIAVLEKENKYLKDELSRI